MAEETISYQMPAYKVNRFPVIYFAGYKNHVSIYPVIGAVAKAMAKEIEPYLSSKATLRFSLTEPLPVELIAAVAKFRAQEAELRPKKKVAKKATPAAAPTPSKRATRRPAK